MHRVLLVTLWFVVSGTCYAQIDENPAVWDPKVLLTAGIGTNSFGPALYVSIATAVDGHLVTARFWKADEFQIDLDGVINTPVLQCREYGLLYGRRVRLKYLELSGSAGVSYVNGVDRGEPLQWPQSKRIDISSIGLPYEARFRLGSGLFSVGGAWYGNVTPRRSFTGAMLQLSLRVL